MAVLSLVVAGFSSAGIGHAIIWSLTAWRLIDGPYMAYRHGSIVAAVLAAAIVGGTIGIVVLACSFSSGIRGGDAWLASMQRTIVGIGPLRAMSIVFAVQMFAIVALEAVEQYLQLGSWLGPAAALGAPCVLALLIHALCAIAVVSAVLAIARVVVRAEARFRDLLAPNAFHRRGATPCVALEIKRRPAAGAARPAPLALRIANRPPPSIAA
jgi:hypothetical protein